ncbi:type II toxin-antitoxin system PemK/MazF family toxin [Candidatus Kaiserbacteria bacterium]|nr:type II toxin-antitoxin system PemK/MazF family toxin [Candidatus Kaiserbacteria bacterium]
MFKKGTVVLVPFPFTDLSGNKVRPGVIISNGKIGTDVVVVFITSKDKEKGKHLVSLKPSESNGLKVASKIVCGKIATLDSKVVLGELGVLSDSDVLLVDKELKRVLSL